MTRSESPRDLFPDQLSCEMRERFPVPPRTARPKRWGAAQQVLQLITRQLDEDTVTLFLDAVVQAAQEATPKPFAPASLRLSAFQTRLGVRLHTLGLDQGQEEIQTSWHLLLALVQFLPVDEVTAVLRCGRDGWSESIALAASLAELPASSSAPWTAASAG